jgi:hypothetical protein
MFPPIRCMAVRHEPLDLKTHANDARSTDMPSLPPPPVPQKLREMLKDYPEHIARLQDALNDVVERPSRATPPFEVAIWMLEGALDTFYSEAREELKAAEANGDPGAIAKAKEKEFVMGSAGFQGRWIGDDGLWNYFQENKEAFE